MGIEFAAQEAHRLWMLNSVRVPSGVKDAEVRKRLLQEFGIEIGGGLGPLAGKTWRIGLMGESSKQEHVLTLIRCLSQILPDYGIKVSGDEAKAAAQRVYGEIKN